MGVIIKGMKIPKSCDVCPFMKTNDDLLSSDYRYMYCGFPHMGEFVTDYVATRHPKCPLGEVPTPHGRLKDADKLTKAIANLIPSFTTPDESGQYDNLIRAEQEAFVDAIQTIIEQPTVIDAEVD